MSENTEETARSTDAASALSALLSNPDALSRVSEVISRLSSDKNGNDPPPSEKNDSGVEPGSVSDDAIADDPQKISPTFKDLPDGDLAKKLPELLSLLSSQGSAVSAANRQQTALLLAIRPYLSKHRQELIDTFIKMNRFGEIFKKLT